MWNTNSATMQVADPLAGDSSQVLRWQFFRGLRACKLMPTEDVDLLERETHTTPFAAVQQMLLDQELLTPYQLERLRDGKPHGLVLGQYRILDEIGGGGFGQVYKAAHTVMDRVVALKLMTMEYCQSRLFRDVFRREVAAVTRLNHPNITLTFDANEIDGILFLAMEYVEGTTLHSFVSENDPPPVPLAVSIMMQIAQGVQHAHENGLVHRDLKPANVLIQKLAPAPDGTPQVLAKVIDFGLARLRAPGDRPAGTLLADAGAIVGTPAFMSPEQATNFHEADGRSDLYSLGCTFYHLLTGRLPFEAVSSRIVLDMHATKPVPPLRDFRPEVPFGLAAVVHRLLAKDPADRYQTAEELCFALAAFTGPALVTESALDRPIVVEAPAPDAANRPTLLDANEHGPTEVPTPVHAVAAEPVSAEALRRLWLEWCVVVEGYARHEPLAVSEARYAQLYRALIVALKVPSAGSELAAAQYDRIQSTIEPWVTLKSLQSLDGDAVGELWRTCQELDRFIAPVRRHDSARWGGRVLSVVALCAVVAGLAYTLVVCHRRIDP